MEENLSEIPKENSSKDLAVLKAEYAKIIEEAKSFVSELKQHLENATNSVTSIDGHKASTLKSKNDASSLNGEISKIKDEIDAIKTHIDTVKSGSETVKMKIESLKSEAESTKNETTSIKDHVDKIKSNADSQLSNIQEVRKNASETAERIEELLKNLTEASKEGESSKMTTLETCYNTVLKNKESIDAVLTKINEYETQLFGTTDDDSTSLNHRLNEFEKKNNAKYEEWNTNYDALFKKIEGLLPGATSTGLAKSYQEQRNKHQWPFWIWIGVFVLATGGMIWFSIYHFVIPNNFQDAFNSILSKIPFFVPAIWLAIFASKQQSKSKRLQEEYAYKETLSKSYESYKREVSALPDSPTKHEMIEKLLQSMVDMMRYNPSETLQSKSHNDSPPIFGRIFSRIKSSNQAQITPGEKISEN